MFFLSKPISTKMVHDIRLYTQKGSKLRIVSFKFNNINKPQILVKIIISDEKGQLVDEENVTLFRNEEGLYRTIDDFSILNGYQIAIYANEIQLEFSVIYSL